MTVAAPPTFDPFADLFIAQGQRPDGLQPVNLRAISPFHRALLALDGTVTKFVEAYQLEPVRIERLSQGIRPIEADQPWLDLPTGSRVLAREVHLRGGYSGRLYAHALSLLALERLPGTMLEALETNPAGLGGALIDSGAETRREILWYGRTREASEDGVRLADVLSRTYRVLSGGHPIMVINERFPLGIEATPDHH